MNRYESEDDYYPEDEAERIPLAWLESMVECSVDDEEEVDWGMVPHLVGCANHALVDVFRDKISECRDANALLLLSLSHPVWAPYAMARMAELVKSTSTWKGWVSKCDERYEKRLKEQAEEMRAEAQQAAKEQQ